MSALFGKICSGVGHSVRSALWHGSGLATRTTQSPLATTWSLSSARFYKKSRFPQYELMKQMPPPPSFSGKGDAYATSLGRKRVIPDPNLPNFERIEPLKWTTWKMLRDVRRRHVFQNYYGARNLILNLKKCRILPQVVRTVAHEYYETDLPRESKFILQNPRCIISGRSRGNLKKYRLSRLVFRNLADYNKLSGVIKACWG